jgi:uncharacterized protein YllA (UPF0747 family)
MSQRTVEALVVTEPLRGSPLANTILAGGLPPVLQPWRPSSAQEWREHIARVQERTGGGWYAAVEAAVTPGGAAARRLGRVVQERGVLVTTGQQPGLFGGPVYTLAKALSALALADTIEARTGVPAAPLFWAGTDDADFLEASVVHVADGVDGDRGGLRELRLTTAAPAGTPMSETPLSRAEMQRLSGELRKACGSAPHSEYVDVAVRSFSNATTLGGGYVAFLRELLQPLGVAVMDASHPAYRRAATPLLRAALERAPAIERSLMDATQALRAAGFEPQVEDDRGLSLVFEIADGTKRRLPVSAAARDGADGVLAPNVLLRPVVERELLPTVTYVGGPGEMAYFVQSNAVARCLDRDPLVVAPRWSCTVIEPFAQRALHRLGVEWRELIDLHAAERRLAERALPADVAAAWKTLRSEVQRSAAEFRRGVRRHDLLPDAVLDGLERSLQHRLARGERRLLAAVKRREQSTRRDLAVASAALFPMGKRQERVLNYVPMLARGGAALLDAMRQQATQHAISLVGAPREAAVASP